MNMNRYVITVRHVQYEGRTGKIAPKVHLYFDTCFLTDASVKLEELRQKYPESRVELFVKLS